ncbi:YitT family protein [Dubosiella muris]|uniref:YitT family protein n=2 Tax=Dubosiella TaxID=1937008 RepID=A0AC61R6W7_9FIRM|nr:YitT family protein [Dubosiella muris]TGY65893.1 YitT family protein [Dubosiella muris]
MNKELGKWVDLVVGSLLFPISVNCFISPMTLNAGGLVGLAQIINYLLPFSVDLTGIINFSFNIPLFILAWRTISKSFCVKTLISLIIQTIGLSCIPILTVPIMPDVLSNCLIGACIGGLGIGLCLRSSGSGGGLDILGVYFSKTRPDFSVGKLSYLINAVVLTISAVLFDLQVALYSLMYIVLMYYVSDQVHYQNISIQALIFSQVPELKKELMTRTGRGITYWDGYGAYTDTRQDILVCVINKYEVRRLKKIVHEVDPKAFVILSDASPVMGNFEKRL